MDDEQGWIDFDRMYESVQAARAELAGAVELVAELRAQVASLTAKLSEVEAAPVDAVASV